MQAVVDEAVRQDFSPSLALAIAHVESNFNPRATSHAGARGVMQIMPATGRGEFGLRAAQLYDRDTNIRTGIKFMKQLINTYDGRVDIALSHYNGGSRVRGKYGRLSIIPATRGYVTKVQSKARDYQRHQLVLATKLNSNIRYASVNRTNSIKAPVVAANRTLSRAHRRASLDDFSNGYVNTKRIAGVKAAMSVGASKREQLMASLAKLQAKNTARSVAANHQYSYHNAQNQYANYDPRIAKVRQWESYR
jgi:hypothetical protein